MFQQLPKSMSAEAPNQIQPLSLVTNQICQRFSLDEIRSATQDFDEAFVIGRGGFGKVYKGHINGSADVVAIKRLHSESQQGATEFQAEVEMLSKLRHCNLVSLIGYCNEGTEMVLVYDYMSHGTLEECLHTDAPPLSWLQRLKICIGAARGLDYLHTGVGTQHGIIHRDVKSSNVLLDENLSAKISDFGLAKICPTNQTRKHVSTNVKGTFGFMDPSYFYTGQLTIKSDVYSFGVVLLEVMCGRSALANLPDEQGCGFAPWAQDQIKKGKLNHIIDSRLEGKISTKGLKDFARIACRCLHNQPNQRPTMGEIVSRLEVILSLQESLASSVTEGKFVEKVLFFFSAKVELKDSNLVTVHSSDYVGEPSGKAVDNVNEVITVTTEEAKVDSGHKDALQLIPFSFNVLKLATRNFRPEFYLSEDSRSSMFKGWIDVQSREASRPGTGTVVFVERLKQYLGRDQKYMLGEINYLGLLNHSNIVKLIGYCLEDDNKLLVYEFMHRGSLEQHLFRRSSTCEPLSWNIRIRIILDVAKGLAYLHCQAPQLGYCDISSSRVLIDSNYSGKLLTCFWTKNMRVVSKVCPYIVGMSHAYAAPEYIKAGLITARSQIYSFGVLLLEVLTGRECIDNNRPHHEKNLVDFSKPYLNSNQKTLQIIDPHIHGQYSPSVGKIAAKIAMQCLSVNPSERPTADEVVQALEKLQEMQKAAECRIEEPNLKRGYKISALSKASEFQKRYSLHKPEDAGRQM